MSDNRSIDLEVKGNSSNPLNIIKSLAKRFGSARLLKKSAKNDREAVELILRLTKLTRVDYDYKNGQIIITPDKNQLELYKEQSDNQDYKFTEEFKDYKVAMFLSTLKDEEFIYILDEMKKRNITNQFIKTS